MLIIRVLNYSKKIFFNFFKENGGTTVDSSKLSASG